ncbi:hypothetical protein IQ265_23205 [Nodosilinea sp. LEGE 06152]|uniref:hypothetical protein n=1 Tax=Nodosilinea sp. LEGE 06152 TaxID=2777966 RepID=UPI00187E76FF|nr:hypothetical protein [Nodosilinea sp. LEGE 06152]MBE9159720.1 hypothetical protein [Nodosilinea sp. LEGE 06152]
MGRRYSDIKRAAKLQQGLTNYINHLQTAATRPSKVGTRGARDLSQIVYIEPFTVGIEADEVVQARCSPTSFTTLSTAINASSIARVTAALGAKTVVNFPKFSPARIVLFRNNTRAVTVATSDVTGLQYLKYNGNRFSCPFGATADIDDQMDSFLDVKARLLTANAAAAVKRVSLVREKVGVEAI